MTVTRAVRFKIEKLGFRLNTLRIIELCILCNQLINHYISISYRKYVCHDNYNLIGKTITENVINRLS